MAAPETLHVRNVVLVGQDGAGKTSLAEAMLYISGQTPRMGTTHDGKSYMDYDPEEIKRKFTMSTSIAPIPYNDYKINLLDTSGHPDFIGDTLATMQAAEMAMFVIDAVAGPQVMTTRLWHEAENMRLSRSVFINHIDRENANFDVIMAQLHARFGSRLGAVTIPIGVDRDFRGVIDVLRMKAHYIDGNNDRIEDIPAEYADVAQAARDKLCDLVAEADDELMMKYLDGEEQLTQEELEGLFDKAIAQELFIPVFVGSTIVLQGIKSLMDDICTYFPHPTAHGPIALADGGEILVTKEDQQPAGFVFKTLADPFVGRLSFVKVISGTFAPGVEVVNSRTRKKDRIGHVYIMKGKETQDVKSAFAGDIIVLPKLDDARTGDTLSHTGDIEIAPLPFPEPLYPIAIEAKDKKEESKLGTFLSRLTDTDPTVRVERLEETHQTVITTMGEAQVQTILNRLKEQANIEVDVLPVRIPYRETITKTAEAQGRHKKQTGGSGQFGDCWLRLEPNPGKGYEFLDAIKGGAIPGGLVPAVDKGVQDAMAEGFLAGYPMQDIKCTVYDGSYHPVDSNEMAFKTAARIGFRAACEKAAPVILEPMVNMNVTVPEEFAGSVMGDVATRRGRIVGTDSNDAGDTIIMVRVPYAEVITYAKDLRSLSRGTGSYTIEHDGYEQAPYDVQQKLVEEYQASRNN
ncbi:Elongation factor G [Slackia heliotrinireducens]|uniref:Small GTP-binding protein domain protein n=1 Tax=Slackia heliotrinireducens (strain ATCC 29202 / DSM 20476 / NCTC 11029 / RHS 1) TaxID=471855 RepID=C7N1D2_SLAHD|nr:elongation factor G [Slackia heliotrinireducens]ACV21224.1 small GTP-binding protein domain protein [Slackia heliotrinireducens DSM 20476]VEG98658.1 Elongation factor G [Slackia heliotrinireducens]